jgi:hypothetical protein
MGNVAAASAYIDINFSKDIVASSLSIKYSEPFVRKTEIGENNVRLDLQHGGFKVGREYTITIVRVDSTSGKQILNKQLRFTAKDVPVSKLGKSQQQALVNKQDQYPYAPEYISYPGFDALLTRGVSSEQLQSMKESMFNYSNAVKKQFNTITLETSSVTYQRHDPEAADLKDHLTFRVKLGSDIYLTSVALDPIDNTAVLQLTNSEGVVVYDSLGSGHD